MGKVNIQLTLNEFEVNKLSAAVGYEFDDINDLRKAISTAIHCFTNYELQSQKQNSVSIDVLDLSVRAHNCLLNAGFDTIEKLSSCSKEELMNIRNLGQRSYYEVLNKLAEYQKQSVLVDDLICDATQRSTNNVKQTNTEKDIELDTM